MDKSVIPKIVYISMGVMILLTAITGTAYWYETGNSTDPGNHVTPLFDLFSDAFKVGLGAFIGVLSQWASSVFGKDGSL
jgi:hypothetical protein